MVSSRQLLSTAAGTVKPAGACASAAATDRLHPVWLCGSFWRRVVNLCPVCELLQQQAKPSNFKADNEKVAIPICFLKSSKEGPVCHEAQGARQEVSLPTTPAAAAFLAAPDHCTEHRKEDRCECGPSTPLLHTWLLTVQLATCSIPNVVPPCLFSGGFEAASTSRGQNRGTQEIGCLAETPHLTDHGGQALRRAVTTQGAKGCFSAPANRAQALRARPAYPSSKCTSNNTQHATHLVAPHTDKFTFAWTTGIFYIFRKCFENLIIYSLNVKIKRAFL
jgi:hypothetical protein